jgi:hypothetical protein
MSPACAPEPAPRRQAANRRLGWSLAVLALAIFIISMLLRS